MEGSNKVLWIDASLSSHLKIDQSLSHDGVCLTVEEFEGAMYRVTAIKETLSKTNLGEWSAGHVVNLERCMEMNARLDGHIVQGHVDSTAKCLKRIDRNGSWEFKFEIAKQYAPLIIEKGSIAINGISLTIFNVSETTFSVGIIPYTFNHTNIRYLEAGEKVNIEFDMIGKYASRLASLQKGR